MKSSDCLLKFISIYFRPQSEYILFLSLNKPVNLQKQTTLCQLHLVFRIIYVEK